MQAGRPGVQRGDAVGHLSGAVRGGAGAGGERIEAGGETARAGVQLLGAQHQAGGVGGGAGEAGRQLGGAGLQGRDAGRGVGRPGAHRGEGVGELVGARGELLGLRRGGRIGELRGAGRELLGAVGEGPLPGVQGGDALADPAVRADRGVDRAPGRLQGAGPGGERRRAVVDAVVAEQAVFDAGGVPGQPGGGALGILDAGARAAEVGRGLRVVAVGEGLLGDCEVLGVDVAQPGREVGSPAGQAGGGLAEVGAGTGRIGELPCGVRELFRRGHQVGLGGAAAAVAAGGGVHLRAPALGAAGDLAGPRGERRGPGGVLPGAGGERAEGGRHGLHPCRERRGSGARVGGLGQPLLQGGEVGGARGERLGAAAGLLDAGEVGRRAVGKLVGADAGGLRALLELGQPAGQRRHRGVQGVEPGRQLGGPAVELADAVREGLGAGRRLRGPGGQAARPAGELGRALGQLLGADVQPVCAVARVGQAVAQRERAVGGRVEAVAGVPHPDQQGVDRLLADLLADGGLHLQHGGLAEGRGEEGIGVVVGDVDRRRARVVAAEGVDPGREVRGDRDAEVVRAGVHAGGRGSGVHLVPPDLVVVEQLVDHVLPVVLKGAVVVGVGHVLVDEGDRQLVHVGGRIPERPDVHGAVEQRDEEHDGDGRARDGLAAEARQFGSVGGPGKHRR